MRSLFLYRIPAILLLLVAVLCAGHAASHTAYAAPAKSRVATPFTISHTCVNSLIIFDITDEMGIDSVRWDYGDTPSGALNTSTDMKGSHIYATIGTYTVTLTAYRAGVADITTQDLTIVQPVPFTFPGNTDTTLCEGQTILLEGPVVPGATYEWAPRKDSVNSSILADTIGTYKVKVNGCWATDSVNVFYTPIPELDLGNDHLLCINEAIRLDATSQNGRYQWYKDFVALPGEKASTYVVTTSGTYTVEVDAGGCGIYKDTVTLNFGGSPHPFSLGPDTLLCPGESIVIDPKMPGATGFQWYNGARTPTITVSRPAEAWVFVNVNNECEVLDTVVVDYNRLRGVDLGNDTVICKGEFLVLTADFGTGTYKWQDSSEQATFYVRETGWYFVRAQIGRCVSRDTVHVQYEDTLRVNLGPDTVLCRGEEMRLYPAGAGGNYKWQDSTAIPIYTVKEPGYYAVVAQNTCGSAVDSVNVMYKDCDCQVYLPTAFSPNNDGKNDYFRPIYRCDLANFKLSVYDRWGARVYYTTDPKVGWTGRQGTTPLNVGTYIWIMEYTNANTNELVKKNGTVTVVY